MKMVAKLLALLGRIEFLAPVLGRLTIAFVFIHSGFGKLTHLDHVVEFFTSLGIPHPAFQAPFAAGTEFLCGCLVLVGLGTRLASFPLIIVMTVAIRTARWDDVDGFLSLFNLSEFLYIVILFMLILTGAGCLSVDHYLRKKYLGSGIGSEK